MRDDYLASPGTFLARITHRLDVISNLMHRLACERSLLREQATRLRLGVPGAEVQAVLDHSGVVVGLLVAEVAGRGRAEVGGVGCR